MTRILIAYTTRGGSTQEIAEKLAENYRTRGSEVSLTHLKSARDLKTYDAFVIGAPIHAYRWLPDAARFVSRNARLFSQKPTALFVTCLAMRFGAEEARLAVLTWLKEVLERIPAVKPHQVGIFAGTYLPEKLPTVDRWIMRMTKEKPADYRDWQKIHAWAETTYTRLITSPATE